MVPWAPLGSTSPTLPAVVPRCLPTLGLGSAPHALGLSLLVLGTHQLLIPVLLLHQRLFVGTPFHSLGGRLRFGILFLAPNCCHSVLTPQEFLNIIYTSTSLSVLVFKCHQDYSYTCFSPSEMFWLFHLLASKITCLYMLLLKTSAGFPIPSSQPYIGFPLGFSGGDQ